MADIQISENASLTPSAIEPDRPLGTSVMRGAVSKCPACGEGKLYRSYLKVNDNCPTCNEALHHHRADDAPPYFTMLIVGHLLVGGALMLEKTVAPATWVHAAIWLPMTLLLTLLLLPPIKGMLVGVQWANRMHGFDPENTDELHDGGLRPHDPVR